MTPTELLLPPIAGRLMPSYLDIPEGKSTFFYIRCMLLQSYLCWSKSFWISFLIIEGRVANIFCAILRFSFSILYSSSFLRTKCNYLTLLRLTRFSISPPEPLFNYMEDWLPLLRSLVSSSSCMLGMDEWLMISLTWLSTLSVTSRMGSFSLC